MENTSALETYLVVELPEDIRRQMARWRSRLKANGVEPHFAAAPWLTIARLADTPLTDVKSRLQELQDRLEVERSRFTGLPVQVRLGGIGCSPSRREGRSHLRWLLVGGVQDLAILKDQVMLARYPSRGQGENNSERGTYVCSINTGDKERALSLLQDENEVVGVVAVTADALAIRVKAGSAEVDLTPELRWQISPWLSKIWPDDQQ